MQSMHYDLCTYIHLLYFMIIKFRNYDNEFVFLPIIIYYLFNNKFIIYN